MTLTINDTTMTSDHSGHTARQSSSGWEVSWLPGHTLDRNTAITAMILAEEAGKGEVYEGHRMWPFIEGWAAELGLTGHDAITRAAQPSADARHQRLGEHRGREAAD